MSAADRERWNQKYAALPADVEPAVDPWLPECVGSLPAGRALDLACGLGAHAVWLAARGWQVDAVDGAAEGLARASIAAARRGVTVNWIAADLDEWMPPAAHYDLILVFRFLDRWRLPPLLERALRPGGHLAYGTFHLEEARRPGSHLRNEEFLLRPGELLRLFPGLLPILTAETHAPEPCVARLLARRPAA